MIKSKNQKISKLKSFLLRAPSKLKQAIRFELALMYFENKDYENAKKIWNNIFKNTKDLDIKVISSLGKEKCLVFEGKYKESLKILNNLKKEKGYSQILWMEIAKVAEEAGNLREALWAYKELKSNTQDMDPNKIYYIYEIAQIEAKLKKI
jgi:predicted negative regulator of RcsB-dependent stress response